jgi:2-succinyl-5-enolpyruvyl-6-hydroxy-3-cyclohexene-1-carboxylate synthase
MSIDNSSNKVLIRELVNTLAAKGIRHVVVSPGSRNAPMVIGFNRNSNVKCTLIPDERSAGFFALGMAQYLNEPVVMVCTSGTAALNYAPALAEAFYQHIPLLAITADRPLEYTHQADGQTIDQKNIFDNYVKAFFQFPQDEKHPGNVWMANRIANEAYNKSIYPQAGPVHINVPLREPLYGTEDVSSEHRVIELVRNAEHLSPDQAHKLRGEIAGFNKIMILNGQLRPQTALDGQVQKASLRPDTVVLAESLSNFNGEKVIPCIDRTLMAIKDDELGAFAPDLLISFDGPVISKKIKAYFRKYKPKEHWHIGNHRTDLDTYQCLTKSIMCSRTFFIKEVLNASKAKKSDYSAQWYGRFINAHQRHEQFLSNAPYSDLSVFGCIIDHLPDHYHWQLGNSSVVRYVQLFDHYPKIPQFGNRGTSGIDGSTSTAAGYAYASDVDTLLITGDIAFFYDTNGLWHRHLSSRLKIILINNGGGNIFKIIEGPRSVPELEPFFVTPQQSDAQKICEGYGVGYQRAENLNELRQILSNGFFQESERALVLEVVTPSDSDVQLKKYFEYLVG